MNYPLLQVKNFLKIRDVEIKENVPLYELSFAKLGGFGELIAYPDSEEKLIDTINTAKKLKIRYKIIGRMSNILPPDGIFHGLLIKCDRMKSIVTETETVTAECGVLLPALAAYFKSHGFSGLEELSGIPGSLGGAVYMNAGAFGKEIADVLSSVRVFDINNNKIHCIPRENIKFSYRHSPFSDGKFCILSASFKYTVSTAEAVGEKMSQIAEKRRKTQPTDIPSLGSTFKKTGEVSAAFLIDKCGLKGARIGGAAVSEKHAGFIVNEGFAESADYKALLNLVKIKVYEKYGVMLEEEIEYL